MSRLLAAFALCALAGAAPPGAAHAADRCAGKKLRAVAAGAACRVALEAREAKSGSAAETAKLERCRDGLASAFAKAEAKPPCATLGDAAAIQSRVDAFADDAGAALAALRSFAA